MDLITVWRLLGLAGALAAVPLVAWGVRRRHESPRARLAALTLLTLFLTFDLTVFGAFTRLSDSGLGCPDWPGCYSQASPLAAHESILEAQAELPSGPVTPQKAWIEMIHRYLAMGVGALIVVIVALAWHWRRDVPNAMTWPLVTLAWVVVQGLFGKYTVTLKLYPAIVSLHLLGAMLLLTLLTVQHRSHAGSGWRLSGGQRKALWLALAALVSQIALGAWVSTNYAVLACSEFPRCSAEQWWPEADWAQGFTVLRALGRTDQGAFLPASALVAIHLAHRSFAIIAVALLGGLAWALCGHPQAEVRRRSQALLALLLLQIATGIANVVLGWPLVGALCHTAGAAAMMVVLVSLMAPARASVPHDPAVSAIDPPASRHANAMLSASP